MARTATIFILHSFLKQNAHTCAPDHKLFDPKMPKEWTFVGKHRAHHAPIRSLAFGESLNEHGQRYFKFFTIAEDMKVLRCAAASLA